MFCESCGSKLKETAKFCGGCGAKVERAEQSPVNQMLDCISLAALPEGISIATVPVEIWGVSGEGPDSDNNINITVKCRCSNDSTQNWNLLKIRTQLLNAFGQVIDETIDTQEELIEVDSQYEWESSFWNVNATLLGLEPEKTHVVVYVSASQKFEFELGQVSIPETALSMINVASKSMDALQLVSCSLWKGAVDDDKESRIEVRALMQNLTSSNVPLVKILAIVSDKQGKELITFDGEDELKAGQLTVINTSSYAKDKKLIGANVALSMEMYWLIACGLSQRQGMEIIPSDNTDNSDDHDDDEEEDKEEGDDSASVGERTILVRFAMTKGEGELPKFSELPKAKQTLAYIVSCMEFSPSFDEVEGNIEAWRIVDSGLGNLTFDKNGLNGYPNPTVEFKVSNVEDDDDFLRGVWESSYRLEIPELNEGDAYYFEDHNGYAKIVETIRNENQDVSEVDTRTFYGNMKWFSPAEQPESLENLPPEFLQAKELWEADKDANVDRIIELISPFVGARFIASNISGWEELFSDNEGEGIVEIESKAVRVVGVEFTDTPIPLCKAEAEFVVGVNADFDSIDLSDWQDKNGSLTDAVIFYWNIPEDYGLEDLDLTCGDNSGVECIQLISNITAMNFNAGWEIRSPDKAICRWFVAWKDLGDAGLVGAVAGYSGGGSFEVERFFAKHSQGSLSELWIDFEDRVNGVEISFDDLPETILAECEKALDCIWDWNDNEVWGDTDEVILLASKRDVVTPAGDMYVYSTGSEPFLKAICEMAGLTSAPN